MPPSVKDKDKDKGDHGTANTRPNTRKRNGSLSTLDELQDIKTALDGRKYLERHLLLCPPGEPTSHGTLSTCLHQISAMAGLTKQAINAIRSTALLLQELEENTINETVKNAFDSQITEFTSDMKLLIEDVNEKIDNHLKTALSQAAHNATPQPPANQGPNGDITPTYASVLANPPPNVNPKLAAREGIRARQFLITGIKESAFGQYDPQKLKVELSKIARETGLVKGKIRSLFPQSDGNYLIEVDSDYAAAWFTNDSNRADFCNILGEGVKFKPRTFNVIAFNVPLTIDPLDDKHKEEINEVNDLEDNAISALRWAKPINRRSEQQRSAHLILSFPAPEAANRAISNGIIICNKKCHVERIKKEPIRCLKCQGWNHMARDCSATNDRCSNCAGDHKTTACLEPHKKGCVSCNSLNHSSWSRECPTFLRKVDEFNSRNPENLLPLFPTADPWTWSTGNANSNPHQHRPNSTPRENSNRAGKQRATTPRDNERNYGSYIPGLERWTTHAATDPALNREWWAGEPVANADNSPQEARVGNNINSFTFVENGSRNDNTGGAGPSNPRSYPYA